MLWLWVLILVVLCWFLNFLRFERYLKDFPGPKPLPLLGSALKLNSTKKSLTALFDYQKKFKGNFRLYIAFEPMIVISEPNTIRYFLTSNTEIQKSKQYTFFNKWLGKGLLISGGQYWKRHRQAITPAFHFQILEAYVSIFDSVSNILIDKLKSELNKDLDIYPLIDLCTLDVMCESAMGTSINAQVNSDSKYVKSVREMGTIVIERTFSAIQTFDFLYQFTKNASIESRALKIIHDYSKSVISKRKETISQSKIMEGDSTSKKQPFLDLLLAYSEDGENFSDEEIRAEVDTFLFAGHDTTASATSLILYVISRDQRVQDKIYKELEIIFSNDPNRSSSYEDLLKMKYLELVIKEGLRLYPSVSLFARTVTENVRLEGKMYPKGATLLFFPYATHRDPKYYTNPDVFYPERFLQENAKDRRGGTFSYIPFSVGPRNCIGQKFAILEMKSIISKVLRHFKLIPPSRRHELELVNEAVLRSLNGVLLQISKRH